MPIDPRVTTDFDMSMWYRAIDTWRKANPWADGVPVEKFPASVKKEIEQLAVKLAG